MKNILLFGDSNTYGLRPEDHGRFDWGVRWSSIVAENLKKFRCQVSEEGLCGRTTVFDDALRPGRRGSEMLVPLLESHGPVDILVIMLGTNDCKKVYNASAEVIGKGIEVLIEEARAVSDNMQILLISPIRLADGIWEDGYDPEFDAGSVRESLRLPDIYRKIADARNCSFMRASDFAIPGKADREHMDADGHKKLGNAVSEKLLSMLAA